MYQISNGRLQLHHRIIANLNRTSKAENLFSALLVLRSKRTNREEIMRNMRINKIKRRMGSVIFGGFLLLLVTSIVLADEKPENVVGFNYQIEYPANQVGEENGYFDLEAEPGTEQTVNLRLNNGGSEKVVVTISVNGTKTNSNGVLEYGPTDIKNDTSLKFPFEKIVSAPKEVEIPANDSKVVPIDIKMPETSFDGMILGGIHMKKKEKEKKVEAQGATIRNTYSYIVAMKLQNHQDSVKPEIKFNHATGSQRNYRNSVVINFSNVTSSLIKDKMDVESQISKKGSEEVLYERKQKGMSMAPNTQMDFYVSMGGEKMQPGDYVARTLVTIDDQKWEEKLAFYISKEEADKYNKRDVGLVQERGLDWKLVALIVGGFLALVIGIFAIVKFIKKKKSQ